MEKTKKRKADESTKLEGDGSGTATQEQEKLRKSVTNLMKKQKLHAVRNIIKEQDGSKRWGQDAKAKVSTISIVTGIRNTCSHSCYIHKGPLYFSGREPLN